MTLNPSAEDIAAVERLTRGFDKGVRFSVASAAGKHSGIWFAWAKGSDFYFGARTILGSTKVSLHQSGICRVALLPEEMARMRDRGLPTPSDRALTKWVRQEVPAEGAVLVASITFPAEYLCLEPKKGRPNKPLLTFCLEPDDQAVEVGFFYSMQDGPSLEETFSLIGYPLFHTRLDNGQTVSMVVRRTTFEPTVLPSKLQLANTTMKFVTDTPPKADEGLVAIFWNAPEPGQSMQMIEVGGVQVSARGRLELPEKPK